MLGLNIGLTQIEPGGIVADDPTSMQWSTMTIPGWAGLSIDEWATMWP